MKKILMSMFLLLILTISVLGAEPFRLDSVGSNKYEVEFTNKEDLSYSFPLNPENGKTVYSEGIPINIGDFFIVSNTKKVDGKGFTHVMRFIDAEDNLVTISDLAAGKREIVCDDDGVGRMVVGGNSYFFELYLKGNDTYLEVDLNGDNTFLVGKRVFISVFGHDGYLDLGPQDLISGYSSPDDIEFFYLETPEENLKKCFGDDICAIKEYQKALVASNNKEYEVEVLVISETSNAVKLRVNGEITKELFNNDKAILADGSILFVEKIDVVYGMVFFRISGVSSSGGSGSSSSSQPHSSSGGSSSAPAQEKIYSVDMKDYPSFLKKNGAFDFSVVVGSQAPGSDVVAAVDILSGLGAMQESEGVKSIEIGAAKLDTEIDYIRNLISVGNPCNNDITKDITGIDLCSLGLKKGQGYIGLYNINNYVQVVVAGYSDFETRLAARALAEWKGTAGKHFLVEGDTLTDYVVYGISSLHKSSESKKKVTPIQTHVIEALPKVEAATVKNDGLTPPNFPDGKTITLELEKGWNLVSLPGRLIQFLDNDCAKKPAAFVFLKDQKRYVSLKEAAKILGDNFSTYLANNAFWIYSYDDCIQKVIVEEYVRDIVLNPGWNLLPSVDLTCSFSSQYWWNAGKQEWQNKKTDIDFAGMIVKTAIRSESQFVIARLTNINGGSFSPSAGYFEGELSLSDIKTGKEYSIFTCSKDWDWVTKNSCYRFNPEEIKQNIEQHKFSMELSGCFVGSLEKMPCEE